MSPDPRDQPYLHALRTVLRAPMVVLADADGQLHPHGVQGVYAYDRRLLSAAVVRIEGCRLEPLGSGPSGLGRSNASFVVRGAGDRAADPTVLLHRERSVDADRVVETLRLESFAPQPVSLRVSLHLASDLADLDGVKQGRLTSPLKPFVDHAGVHWSSAGGEAHVKADPLPDKVSRDAEGADLAWQVTVARGTDVEMVCVTTGSSRGTTAPFTAATDELWADARVESDDRRVATLATRSLGDLQGLLLSDVSGDGTDVFAAAGSPWFFTLFGRDALWTARLLMPFGTELAMGTLRALARRQGRADVPATEEQPGKILHEVRRDGLQIGTLSLPPTYYGSVDATPLWILTLVEAWRWGASPAEVRALLPALERALGWLRRQVDADPTGFVRYIDHSGTGLTNQGWKDSGDSIQWADGRLADAPIALSEVQAYAYQAAAGGADLLDAFDRPGAESLRQFASALRERFRNCFWVSDQQGAYPAMALDREGGAVDGIGSNMGHLLGTGLLDPAEAAAVAARLAGTDLDSGLGLRSLSSRAPTFSPLSYHCGAIWPHDTVIAARGLLLEGHDEVAASLLGGVLVAAQSFEDRLPELYAGTDAAAGALPYPAACRPQAWAAAAGTCVATLALGLEVDAPAGALQVRPLRSRPWGRVQVEGLRVGGHRLDVTVAADGTAEVATSHPSLHRS